jgi:hypothetical protein
MSYYDTFFQASMVVALCRIAFDRRRRMHSQGQVMGGTVGDFSWERLHEWGIKAVFGYPGDGINGLLGALSRAKGKVRFIQARH